MGETRQQQEQHDPDAQDALQERPPPAEVEEIEAERRRRLAPENRPENAEVDNTGRTLPTVEEFARRDADGQQEGSAGSADPSEVFRRMRPTDDEVAEIEAERRRRHPPENPPANAQVAHTRANMPDVARD